MAEPRSKSGPLEIHVAFVFDRLLESKLAQAYSILVPTRERPVERVKECDHDADGGHLCTGIVGTTTRREHHCQPDSIADRVCQEPRFGSAAGVDFRR